MIIQDVDVQETVSRWRPAMTAWKRLRIWMLSQCLFKTRLSRNITKIRPHTHFQFIITIPGFLCELHHFLLQGDSYKTPWALRPVISQLVHGMQWNLHDTHTWNSFWISCIIIIIIIIIFVVVVVIRCKQYSWAVHFQAPLTNARTSVTLTKAYNSLGLEAEAHRALYLHIREP